MDHLDESGAPIQMLIGPQRQKDLWQLLLRMLDDTMQGTSIGLGFVLGGTPEFLQDNQRGLHSYKALQGRLSQNSFTSAGPVDYPGPLIRLAALTAEDFYVLLQKIRQVYAYADLTNLLLPDEALEPFWPSRRWPATKTMLSLPA